ncbi:response regulator [Candidatus Clostridium radicumherbarum]|uniref:Stage 0 sporulation protein A homolog n=1 Tax=Candidatus Clostridium radicumherbarum TaxID=3381662 RepID=A0ABW8TUW1_9CLOT
MRKYKLLIVDDEIEVRKGIINKVDWDKLGFEIVGEGENGKEALEIFEKTMPDVLLTDIKMPFMDGLQLTQCVKEKYPTTKVIVMTGFDEFEYAHKAIKLNVSEYILRPVGSVELSEILTKVKKQIDDEIAEKENVEALKEYYRKSIPVLKDKFLTSLITTTMEKEDIEEGLRSYDINLRGSSYIVSIISIDEVMQYKNKSEDLNNIATDFYEHKALFKFALLNIVEEITDKNNTGTAFLNGENVVIISAFKEEKREKVSESILKSLEELRLAIEKFLKFTVTIGVGSICNDVIYISHSYENALAALNYKIFMGENRIIWIEDIEPGSVSKVVFDENKERTLANCLKVGTGEEMIETIDKLFEDVIAFKASYKDYQIYIMEILTTILKAARDSNIDIDNIFGINHNLLIELYSLKSVEEAQSFFKDICMKIMSNIVKDRIDTYKELVHRAKEYVKENYKSSEVNINGVCNYLHISPTYFSFIFKKETKTTFINYVTQVRMEAAKELLRTSNLKSFEIAEKVGYSEPNYFSYSFKKKFGQSPSEYRSSAK